MAQQPADRLQQHLESALNRGMDHAVVVSPSQVVTAPWVILKCQYGCPHFGKCHCCPPMSPSSERTRAILDSYTTAILLRRRGGPDRGSMTEVNEAAVDLELALFFDGYYKAFSMGSGVCRRCEECASPGPCRHPDRARPSMEACGIDVFATARSLGPAIETLRTRDDGWDAFALILVE